MGKSTRGPSRSPTTSKPQASPGKGPVKPIATKPASSFRGDTPAGKPAPKLDKASGGSGDY